MTLQLRLRSAVPGAALTPGVPHRDPRVAALALRDAGVVVGVARHDHPRRCQRRRDRPPRPPGRRRPPMKASSAPLGDSVAVTAAGAGIRSWRCRGGAAARPSAKMVCGGPLGVGAARRDTLAVERPASPRPVGGAGVPPTGRVGSRGRHHRSSQASASAPWRAMAASVSAGSLSRVSVTPRVAVSPSPRRRRVNSAPG